MEQIIASVVLAFSLKNLGYLLIGCIVGLIVGVLPGLGPVFGTALFLPLTFSLPVDSALILLAAIYASTAYGDGITSILMNVPGGPSGVAVTFDGYPLTRMGRAGEALGALAGSALVGDLIGIVVLVTVAPTLANLALKIGPAEYFMLTMFGLSMVAMISKGSGQAVKGLIMGCVGLAISFIGRDVITGSQRFTFGIPYLEDGVPFICASIGLFALSQAFILSEEGGSIAGENVLVTEPWNGVLAVIKNWWVTIRSAFTGVFLAMIPGMGITTSSLLSYLIQQRTAKDSQSYGQGNIKGVIAPQAASNATTAGELIPALSLGIPSGATSAIFIAALTLHGLRPGLDFFTSGGTKVYAVFVGMILAAFVFFIIGMTCIPFFAKITKIPNAIIVPVIIVLSFVGSFALRNMVQDVIVTITFGFLGYFFTKHKWPVQCIVLGMVLGSMAENNFH
ncbi:MAG TPA: tripartite tricarboxylate transporter permease, partial [Desulfosporosinus sp.]|nr:tripartite tricarboxylate transporter permease [Desulfosporosinus sp.]